MAQADIPQPSVFDFVDYREFLRACYAHKKAVNPKFSYRLLAQKVGFRSPGFFTQVIQGQCNISAAMLNRFADFAGLQGRQRDFFESMVHFNQAKTQEEKQRHLEKLVGYRRSRIALVEADRYEYYKHWYFTAVRELLAFYDFRGDYAALGRKLHPPITATQAKQAIEVLLRLGFIKQTDEGSYRQSEALLTTGLGVRSPALAGYQMAVLDLAKAAVDQLPSGARSISTLTLSLDEEGQRLATERIHELRRELLQLAATRELPDRVVQVNFQLFPMSRKDVGKT